MRTTDYQELKAYQNRYVNPNAPIKRNQPAWLNKERKLALLELYSEFPDNCLLGHYLCRIPEHYAHFTQSYYTIGQEHDEPIINEDVHTKHVDNGNIVLKNWSKYKTDDEGNILYVKVVESVNVPITEYEILNKHELLIDNAVKEWSEDYRIEQLEQWHRERRELHRLNEKQFPLRGRFNNISSVIFHESQPLYYIHRIGLDAIHMIPYAMVRLASSRDCIMVSLPDVNFKGISKNAKHKLLRYNKPIPESINSQIEIKVKGAVKSYLGI